VTTTKESRPEFFYPTMVFNKANILEMMPLTMKQPWLSLDLGLAVVARC
jgi:hypothetical protein